MCADGRLTGLVQLEDILSWQCGHPQMRHVQPVLRADTDVEMPDLQLNALANLERHADCLNAFSDEEDEEELRSLYLVCMLDNFAQSDKPNFCVALAVALKC
jgi:hypothetical protein